MLKVFIAGTNADALEIDRLLGDSHEQTSVESSVADALAALKKENFDLIMIGVHFAESRMFDLLRLIPKSNDVPIICFCLRDTPLTRMMHETIAAATSALGAWMYIDQHEYNVVKNPDAEMRRVIERCLTGEERKRTQESRKGIQEHRVELQRLRESLERHDWSEDLEERVLAMRGNLDLALVELCQLQRDSLGQQEDINASRDKNDKVSSSVESAENQATRDDCSLAVSEETQARDEINMEAREAVKKQIGRKSLKVR